MASDTIPSLSLNEREFITQSVQEGHRLDGRTRYEFRQLRVTVLNGEPGSDEKSTLSLPSNTNGAVTLQVQLGGTRIIASASCHEVEPDPGRPTEGFYQFDLQFAPLASEASLRNTTAQKHRTVEAARLIEKGLRNSRAIDTEALCLIPHERVHLVRVDLRVVDDDGDVVGAASMAAITALKLLRRPPLQASSTPLSTAARLYLTPIPMHHLPFVVSFALYDDGNVVVDPSWKEEQAAAGHLFITMNKHGDICNLQKAGGVPLEPAQLAHCAQIAASQVEDITEQILSLLPDES